MRTIPHIHTHLNTYKCMYINLVHFIYCAVWEARATTTTATIVLEIQIQTEAAKRPLWDHQLAMGPWGDGNALCTQFIASLFCNLLAIKMQRKANVELMKAFPLPSTPFPRLDGAACWAEYAVKSRVVLIVVVVGWAAALLQLHKRVGSFIE